MTKRLASLIVLALAFSLVAASQKDEAKKKAPEKKAAQSKKEAPEKEKEKEKEGAKAGDPAAGAAVFEDNCAQCHFADSTEKRIGPGLKGLFHREKLFDGRPVNEENVRDLIVNGGGKMIPFKEKLEPAEIANVIAYLKTL